MNNRTEHVWVLAGSASVDDGVGAAVLVRNGDGKCVGFWSGRTSAADLEHGALIAVIRGLRQARDNNAQRVTVICPFERLMDQLARRTPVEWNDPMASHWAQARALSHGFLACEFQKMPEPQSRGISRMAATSVQGRLPRAA